MKNSIVALSAALVLLGAAASSAPAVSAAGDFRLQEAIAFTSTRDCPSCANPVEFFSAAEIYLGNPDFTDPNPVNWRITKLWRLTENTDADSFAALSPDGKKIVFDSNRNRLEGSRSTPPTCSS